MQPLREAEKIDGWMSPKELKWIRSAALSRPPGAKAVEVGSWLGRSTVAMDADHIDLTCVDTWLGSPGILSEVSQGRDIYREFMANMIRLGINAAILRMDATLAAAKYPDGFLDWIFLDCDKNDFPRQFWAWYRKLKNGGLYSGHDYSPEFPAVKQTLTEAEGRIKAFEHKVVPGTSIWWFVKPFSY